MVNVFIIAAGNGSRLGSDIPKALYPIAGTPNILNTVHHIYKAAERAEKEVRVIVVCSVQRIDKFQAALKGEHMNHPQLEILPISSGLGDGHAVMTAIGELPDTSQTEESIIIWGDAIISYTNIGLIEELLRFELNDRVMALPVPLGLRAITAHLHRAPGLRLVA